MDDERILNLFLEAIVGEAMKERITKLLNDYRLDYLVVTPEFSQARARLLSMQKKAEIGVQIDSDDQEYIEYTEKHIENIDPQWDYGIIEGQLVPYRRTIKKKGEDR